MTKTKFTLLVCEILNEYDCKIIGLEYGEDGICTVNYSPDAVVIKHFYCAYRFMNRARLKRIILTELDLLEPSGFPFEPDSDGDF